MENKNNTYEELVQLKESGEIGWREFIRRQPEMEDDYYHWCVENDLDMNEETAEAFMTLTEEHVLAYEQTPSKQNHKVKNTLWKKTRITV